MFRGFFISRTHRHTCLTLGQDINNQNQTVLDRTTRLLDDKTNHTDKHFWSRLGSNYLRFGSVVRVALGGRSTVEASDVTWALGLYLGSVDVLIDCRSLGLSMQD